MTNKPYVNPAIREVIVEVLCSQALADHLGDVRDAERKLWELIGIDPSDDGVTCTSCDGQGHVGGTPCSDCYGDGKTDDPDVDYNSAWSITERRLKRNGIPLPDYLEDSED